MNALMGNIYLKTCIFTRMKCFDKKKNWKKKHQILFEHLNTQSFILFISLLLDWNFKMLLSKVFLLLIFSTLIASHIEINIDPEDLDRVSDFVLSLNNQHAVIPLSVNYHHRISKFILKTAYGLSKLISIMLTLVGANILSAKFDVIFPSVNFQSDQNNNDKTDSCMIDYGCIKNLCWRSCHGNMNKKNQSMLWCFTAPFSKAREFHSCTRLEDCSPCWECIEACHT